MVVLQSDVDLGSIDDITDVDVYSDNYIWLFKMNFSCFALNYSGIAGI